MSFPFIGRLFGLANDAPLPDPDFKTKQALLLGVHVYAYVHVVVFHLGDLLSLYNINPINPRRMQTLVL